MISNEQFKLLIEQLKLSSGLKQSEIAGRLSVKSTYLSDMINGRVPITENVLKKISEEFHVNNFGDKNITAGIINHSTIDNRSYYSDSPDVLRARIEQLDRLLEEKECRIKEKDAQIKEKDAQIKEKDAQIKALLEIVAKK